MSGVKAGSSKVLSTEISKPKFSNNHAAEESVLKETSMIKNANDALMRLQVSLFKNIQDPRMIPI